MPAGLTSPAAIGAQLPGKTLLHVIAPVGARARQESHCEEEIRSSGAGERILTNQATLLRGSKFTSMTLLTAESVCMPWKELALQIRVHNTASSRSNRRKSLAFN